MKVLSRRQTLQAIPLLGVAVGGVPPVSASAATPACDDNPTSSNDEGPFFKPQSPARTSLLEPNMPGMRMLVMGSVASLACEPIASAIVDFWHADDNGDYDNDGYHLRGHLLTDREGRFRLETIVPGLYPGRTRHFHVKVAAPGGRALTTQLYFPEERLNARDGLFRPDLVMRVGDDGGLKTGTFDFVLKTT